MKLYIYLLNYALKKEDIFRTECYNISEQLSSERKNSLAQAKEKGASSWLTTLPLESLGYVLNKREF